MATAKHSERAHALLSASGSSRWLNCTPSPRLEEKFEETRSVYAEEGTLAHEFGELSLRKHFKEITPKKYKSEYQKHAKHELYSPEMDTYIEQYVEYIVEQFSIADSLSGDAVILIEEKVDLTDYIEDGFGTCDVIIIADGVMYVIDLKYGKGERVEADDNSQLKLYGLGAYEGYNFLYDIRVIQLAIIQPRLDHISEWQISAEDLITWGEKEVKPAAALAYEGKGLQKAGDHCRWCKAQASCGTLSAFALELTRDDFRDEEDDSKFKPPHFLTQEQLLFVYNRLGTVIKYAEKVKKFMLIEALNGRKWEGLKVVEGRSTRKWIDEEKAIEALEKQGFSDDKILNTKIKGLGDITKIVGGKKNFETLLSSFIVKPPGKPALVPETDKRQAYNVTSAADDFAD